MKDKMIDFHPKHLCGHCGSRFDAHAGKSNPHTEANGCPGDHEPRWPTTIKDEDRAGKAFDRRLAFFWGKRNTTFEPI